MLLQAVLAGTLTAGLLGSRTQADAVLSLGQRLDWAPPLRSYNGKVGHGRGLRETHNHPHEKISKFRVGNWNFHHFCPTFSIDLDWIAHLSLGNENIVPEYIANRRVHGLFGQHRYQVDKPLTYSDLSFESKGHL
jgi:hypothetical protein